MIFDPEGEAYAIRKALQQTSGLEDSACLSLLADHLQAAYVAGLRKAAIVAAPFETKRWVSERGRDENASESIAAEIWRLRK